MKELIENLSVLDSILTVKIVTPDVPTKKDVLFLHGAGMATLDRYTYLSDLATKLGYRALMFNFSGHGTSSGKLQASSLERRNLEAQLVISNYGIKQPFSVIASSMGGYNAIKLAANYQVGRLILFCPAAYATEAYSIPFTEEFSNIIRKPFSWSNSDVFDYISKFEGELIIIVGTNDEIIPFEIVRRIYDNASNCQKKTLLQLDAAPHALHSWLMKSEQDAQLQRVISLITESLSR